MGGLNHYVTSLMSGTGLGVLTLKPYTTTTQNYPVTTSGASTWIPNATNATITITQSGAAWDIVNTSGGSWAVTAINVTQGANSWNASTGGTVTVAAGYILRVSSITITLT